MILSLIELFAIQKPTQLFTWDKQTIKSKRMERIGFPTISNREDTNRLPYMASLMNFLYAEVLQIRVVFPLTRKPLVDLT